MLYDIIYDFFYSNLFTSSALAQYESEILGVTTNLNEYLSHTATLTILILGIVILLLLVRWCFRVFAGLIKV